MILAIETSSLVSSIAIGSRQKLAGELTIQNKLTHSEQLIPHIDTLLQLTGVEKKELNGIAISMGPGSFTGLRIGMGTAKAMAYGLQIPIKGVKTPLAMAYNQMDSNDLIAVLIDGQKNNVYFSLYRFHNFQIEVVEDIQVLPIEDVLSKLVAYKSKVIFLGDGVGVGENMIKEASPDFILAPPHTIIPRGTSVLQCALQCWDSTPFHDPMSLVPYYIRRSEAEVLWEKKHTM